MTLPPDLFRVAPPDLSAQRFPLAPGTILNQLFASSGVANSR